MEQLLDQEREIQTIGVLEDLEAETLRELAETRNAIEGEVKDAESIAAVRAALTRLFERFVIHLEPGAPGEPYEGRIEAVIKPEAVRTVDEDLRPILRPTALDLGPTSNSTDCLALKARASSGRSRCSFDSVWARSNKSGPNPEPG